MDKLNVIKVGGAVVEDARSLCELINSFVALEGFKVLVHGGGRSATRLADRLGIETKMIDGRRVTDADMLDVVTMVYGGLVNKRIVAMLQAKGVNALGLTGADMNVIHSHQRPPVARNHQIREQKSVTLRNSDCNPTKFQPQPYEIPIANLQAQSGHSKGVGLSSYEMQSSIVNYGYVGDIDFVDGARLSHIIADGIVPIMAPLSHDGQGNMLNVNADTIAAATASALAPYYDVTLTYCFEKPGVLRNPDDDTTVIPLITSISYPQLLADGIVSSGMIPKLANAFDALSQGVHRVMVTSHSDLAGMHGTTIS